MVSASIKAKRDLRLRNMLCVKFKAEYTVELKHEHLRAQGLV